MASLFHWPRVRGGGREKRPDELTADELQAWRSSSHYAKFSPSRPQADEHGTVDCRYPFSRQSGVHAAHLPHNAAQRTFTTGTCRFDRSLADHRTEEGSSTGLGQGNVAFEAGKNDIEVTIDHLQTPLSMERSWGAAQDDFDAKHKGISATFQPRGIAAQNTKNAISWIDARATLNSNLQEPSAITTRQQESVAPQLTMENSSQQHLDIQLDDASLPQITSEVVQPECGQSQLALFHNVDQDMLSIQGKNPKGIFHNDSSSAVVQCNPDNQHDKSTSSVTSSHVEDQASDLTQNSGWIPPHQRIKSFVTPLVQPKPDALGTENLENHQEQMPRQLDVKATPQFSTTSKGSWTVATQVVQPSLNMQDLKHQDNNLQCTIRVGGHNPEKWRLTTTSRTASWTGAQKAFDAKTADLSDRLAISQTVVKNQQPIDAKAASQQIFRSKNNMNPQPTSSVAQASNHKSDGFRKLGTLIRDEGSMKQSESLVFAPDKQQILSLIRENDKDHNSQAQPISRQSGIMSSRWAPGGDSFEQIGTKPVISSVVTWPFGPGSTSSQKIKEFCGTTYQTSHIQNALETPQIVSINPTVPDCRDNVRTLSSVEAFAAAEEQIVANDLSPLPIEVEQRKSFVPPHLRKRSDLGTIIGSAHTLKPTTEQSHALPNDRVLGPKNAKFEISPCPWNGPTQVLKDRAIYNPRKSTTRALTPAAPTWLPPHMTQYIASSTSVPRVFKDSVGPVAYQTLDGDATTSLCGSKKEESQSNRDILPDQVTLPATQKSPSSSVVALHVLQLNGRISSGAAPVESGLQSLQYRAKHSALTTMIDSKHVFFPHKENINPNDTVGEPLEFATSENLRLANLKKEDSQQKTWPDPPNVANLREKINNNVSVKGSMPMVDTDIPSTATVPTDLVLNKREDFARHFLEDLKSNDIATDDFAPLTVEVLANATEARAEKRSSSGSFEGHISGTGLPKENFRATQGVDPADELLDFDGSRLPAPVDWDDRQMFDNTSSNEYVKEWSAAVKILNQPIDISRAEYTSGAHPIGDENLELPPRHEASIPADPKAGDVITVASTSADAIAKAMLKIHEQSKNDKMIVPAQNQRRYKLAAKQPEVDPFSPHINMYLRAATPHDSASIAAIYNYYVNKTIIPEDQKPVSVEDIAYCVKSCKGNELPFIVAVKGDLPPTTDAVGRQPFSKSTILPQHEIVIGFAFAEVYNFGINGLRSGRSRSNAVLQLYVDHNHQHKGVGRNLLDRLLHIVSYSYGHRNAAKWANPAKEIAKTYDSGQAERWHSLFFHVPVEKQDDLEFIRVSNFLGKFFFNKECVLRSAARTSTEHEAARFVDLAIFQGSALPADAFAPFT